MEQKHEEKVHNSLEIFKIFEKINKFDNEAIRDIIDESDEIFSVKNQLIYTVGN